MVATLSKPTAARFGPRVPVLASVMRASPLGDAPYVNTQQVYLDQPPFRDGETVARFNASERPVSTPVWPLRTPRRSDRFSRRAG